MKIFLPCQKCQKAITPDMDAAVKEGKCPFCGEKFDIGDLPSAFLVIQTIQELKLPLSAAQVKAFLDTLLKTKMEMTFPEITIEAEPADNVRAKVGPRIPQLKQEALGAPTKPKKELKEDDFGDEDLNREESASADNETVDHFKKKRIEKDEQGNVIYHNNAAVEGKKERMTGDDKAIIFGPYGQPGNTPEEEGRKPRLHVPLGYKKPGSLPSKKAKPIVVEAGEESDEEGGGENV